MPTKDDKITVKPTLKEEIEARTAASVAKFVGGLDQMIEQNLRASVAGILGFSKSFGSWEVDHCNGRMSVISEFIGHEARTAANEAAAKILTPELVAETIEKMKESIIRDFVGTFSRQLHDSVYHYAKEAADKTAQQIIGEFKFDRINLATVDPADPNSALVAAITEAADNATNQEGIMRLLEAILNGGKRG